MTDRIDLLAHFPPGFSPRPEQARLLAELADGFAEALDDPTAPYVFLVEAPPGVGKSHVAMTLARWSGDAYLLTSQKLLQDQYEREFGADCRDRYWAILEALFTELGYRDYLGALQRYRVEHPHDVHLLSMSSYLVDYPFANRVYPGALDVL